MQLNEIYIGYGWASAAAVTPITEIDIENGGIKGAYRAEAGADFLSILAAGESTREGHFRRIGDRHTGV